METARRIAEAGGRPRATVAAAVRAAWEHDAVKQQEPAGWRRRIADAGETPDPWAEAHGVGLLHAQAAAAWARQLGESDPEGLAAVRHHPTAHPGWGVVGRILYVADFCEPLRAHAERVGAKRLRKRAGEGDEGLAEAARAVLRLRLEHLLAAGRAVHPDSFRAWNAWIGDGS
ncbi:MAG: hypothetical protein R3326_03830 [Gemmatimonadota bacterium]|nr:hypothetical protein [Gemmatimonadota bacterium]